MTRPIRPIISEKCFREWMPRYSRMLVAALVFGVAFLVLITVVAVIDINKNSSPKPTTPLTIPESLTNLYQHLPNNTRATLNDDSDSPQRRAWNWMSTNEGTFKTSSLSDWQQTLAMATFYLALLGDIWDTTPFLHQHYLLPDNNNVCDWYFPPPEIAYSTLSQCDSDGRIMALEVTELDLILTEQQRNNPNFKFLPNAQLPPELALLSSLQSIVLIYNGIDAPLSQMFPVETLQQLSKNNVSLQVLNLWGNNLRGTIPTELGLLTTLQQLSLSGSLLSGALPSELGRLTNLSKLYLPGLDLGNNTIPPELEWLERMDGGLVLDDDSF